MKVEKQLELRELNEVWRAINHLAFGPHSTKSAEFNTKYDEVRIEILIKMQTLINE